MSDSFILCDGLVKIYQVAEIEMVALQGLNLTVEKGELMGIIGASGSGKSTLMSILGGLDRPTAGRVRVDGQDLLKMPDRQLNRYRREKVGFVWQQSTRNLVPYLNAVQNVVLPMTLAGSTGKEQRMYAEELLDMVGLADRKAHHLPELSGGEQQRVAIAVALANKPTLLLGDEPTGEVDSATADVIYDTFQTLTHEIGLTTLIVSHDPNIAQHVDRVIRIRDGMLASETRRQYRAANGDQGSEEGGANGEAEPEVEEHFEELVVLDKAGRVHIPQELLEELQIAQRARLEVTEEGILIRPVDEGGAAAEVAAGEDSSAAAETTSAEAEPESNQSGLRGLMGRFRRSSKAPDDQ